MIPTQIAFSIVGGKLVARSAGAAVGDATIAAGAGGSIVEPRGEVVVSESATPSIPAQIAFFITGGYLGALSSGAAAGNAAMNRIPTVGDTYLQPDGVFGYFQPDGTSIYLQPA